MRKERREKIEKTCLAAWALPWLAGSKFSRRLLTSEEDNLYQAHEYFTGEQIQAARSRQNCPSHSGYFKSGSIRKIRKVGKNVVCINLIWWPTVKSPSLFFFFFPLSYWLYALNQIPSHASCMHTHKSNKLLDWSLILRTKGTVWLMFTWLKTPTPQKCMVASKPSLRNGPWSFLTSHLHLGTV